MFDGILFWMLEFLLLLMRFILHIKCILKRDSICTYAIHLLLGDDQVSQILKQRKAQHHCLACQTACSLAFQKILTNYLLLKDSHVCLFFAGSSLMVFVRGFKTHTASPVQDNEDCISQGRSSRRVL